MNDKIEKDLSPLRAYPMSVTERKSLFEIQIWTIDDLAIVLNCSKGSIYNKVSKNEIPFHKKGVRGRLYFIPSEILEWIKEGDYR